MGDGLSGIEHTHSLGRERGKFQPYEALYILSKVYDVNVGLTLMDWAIEKEA